MASNSEAATATTRRPFPGVGESITFGWETLRDNIGVVLVWAVIFGVFSAISDIAIPDSGSDARIFWIGFATFVAALVANLIQVIAIRRSLDYWDERHGLAQPKNFSAAWSSSLREAAPRLLPSIGWSLLPIIGLAAVIAATFFVLVEIDVLWVTVFVIVVEIAVAFYLTVIWGFYNQAVIDCPGNPFTRSAQVAKGHFWEAFGALFVLGLILFAAGFVAALIVTLIDPSSAASDTTPPLADAATSTLGAIVAFGFINGSMSNMYRSVFPTSDS